MKRSMMIAAVALSAAVLGSSHADARQWWVVDYSNNTCHQAIINGQELTPDAMERGLRAETDVEGPPTVNVKKDDNGNVLGVAISATYKTGNSTVIYFGTSYQVCEVMRQWLVEHGELTRRSDLQ